MFRDYLYLAYQALNRGRKRRAPIRGSESSRPFFFKGPFFWPICRAVWINFYRGPGAAARASPTRRGQVSRCWFALVPVLPRIVARGTGLARAIVGPDQGLVGEGQCQGWRRPNWQWREKSPRDARASRWPLAGMARAWSDGRRAAPGVSAVATLSRLPSVLQKRHGAQMLRARVSDRRPSAACGSRWDTHLDVR
jgi:hypothetical protein